MYDFSIMIILNNKAKWVFNRIDLIAVYSLLHCLLLKKYPSLVLLQCEHLHLLLSLQQLYVAGKHEEGTVAVYALFCVLLTLKSLLFFG